MKNLIFTFESKKAWGTLCLFLFIILIYAYSYLEVNGAILYSDLGFYDLKSTIISILTICVSILFIKQIIWSLGGKLIIEFENDKLLATNKYFFLNMKKTYLIPQITDLEIRKNVDSGTSWRFPGVYFAERDKKILFFNYNGKETKLGVKIIEFRPEKIMTEIKLRTTSVKRK